MLIEQCPDCGGQLRVGLKAWVYYDISNRLECNDEQVWEINEVDHPEYDTAFVDCPGCCAYWPAPTLNEENYVVSLGKRGA